MQVYRELKEIPRADGTCLTVGMFDGVHVGHSGIIRSLTDPCAERGGRRSLVLTFDRHPQSVLNGKTVPLLTTGDEKLRLMSLFKLDAVALLPFTRELASLTPEQFIAEVCLNRLGMTRLVVGPDHAFGKNREGDRALLERLSAEHGFQIQFVESVVVADQPVSSTRIRALLADGDVESAGMLLGRNYSVRGTVVPGQGIGRTLKVPTANIGMESEEKLIPGNGVYGVEVFFQDTTYRGVCNIGFAPSLKNHAREIEVHLLDYRGDLYGESLVIRFFFRIRNEITFVKKDILIEQIQKDIALAREWFSTHE